jgi:hypothetical protein
MASTRHARNVGLVIRTTLALGFAVVIGQTIRIVFRVSSLVGLF